MKKFLPFVVFWIFDALLVYVSAVVYPAGFTLGNFRFSTITATIWAALWVTALVWFAGWLVNKLKIKLSGRAQMFIFYWLADSAAVWITARLATLTGFGIASFWMAIALGLILDLVQYAVWKLGKFSK